MPLTQFSELDLVRVTRDRIDGGQLPRILPGRVWGSPSGAGEICSLCDRAILPCQSLLELDGRPNIQFHVVCHAIWERECRARQRKGVERQSQRTAGEPLSA
jgi:hypothetical protein